MNYFDVGIITYINQFAQHSRVFDQLVVLLAYNHLLKGGVLVMMIWWAWFKPENHYTYHREHILSMLVSCLAAMTVARVLAVNLPFRARPMHEAELHLVLPYSMEPTSLAEWSSFPSDHAVVFFALATSLLFVSRKVGVFALAYVALFIAMPRIYLGLHYPTDLIAGAIIGIAIALLGNTYLIKSKYIQLVASWSDSMPHVFYPLFAFFTFEIANMFDSSRELLGGLVHILIG